MDTSSLCSCAEANAFPALGDTTALEKPDLTWQDLITESTTVGWTAQLVEARRGRRAPSSMIAAGLSETNAFPALRDAIVLEMPDLELRDFKTARAGGATVVWIIPPEKERRIRLLISVASTGPSEVSVLPLVLDATKDREEGTAMLEIAAEKSDEMAFVQAVSEIDWPQRPAADFARAVRLALAAGAHLLARNLAAQGARLHPDHLELQKMARILAPPRVVRADLPPDPSVQANHAWLRAHADEYRGRWVALRNGQLIAMGYTARELKAQLESTDGILLTRVF